MLIRILGFVARISVFHASDLFELNCCITALLAFIGLNLHFHGREMQKEGGWRIATKTGKEL